MCSDSSQLSQGTWAWCTHEAKKEAKGDSDRPRAGSGPAWQHLTSVHLHLLAISIHEATFTAGQGLTGHWAAEEAAAAAAALLGLAQLPRAAPVCLGSGSHTHIHTPGHQTHPQVPATGVKLSHREDQVQVLQGWERCTLQECEECGQRIGSVCPGDLCMFVTVCVCAYACVCVCVCL